MAKEQWIFILVTIVTSVQLADPDSISLPRSHKARQFGPKCWGYEPHCSMLKGFSRPRCKKARDPYSGRPMEELFYEQTDFGYLKKIADTVQPFCESRKSDGKGSSLKCSKDLLYCEAENIFIDFKNIAKARESLTYKMDVLKRGEFGGRCDTFWYDKLQKNFEFMSPLQSWAPEMRFFGSVKDYKCDIVVDKPTFFMKLDATVNMYHHFCDFFNLYASQHLLFLSDNSTAFNQDVNILIWDNNRYISNFADAFKAFTSNRLQNLVSYGGKKVCFKKAVFPLLPRMVFGLYYNTPMAKDCSNSGLFKAFSEFMLHRLKIKRPRKTDSKKLRVTILSRQTRYRKALNEQELVQALENTGKYDVSLAPFTHGTDFLHQLSVIRKTDILVGIHGAGLTHSLFLPDWAVLFELHNCGDRECYEDLSRLRGIKYITWTDESLVERTYPGNEKEEHPAHEKFANYRFDQQEFVKKVNEAAEYVLEHPQFQKMDKNEPKDEL